MLQMEEKSYKMSRKEYRYPVHMKEFRVSSLVFFFFFNACIKERYCNGDTVHNFI